MATRGSYLFEADDSGRLVDNQANLTKLRALFRDGDLIDGRWGPGDRGDFDHGSWHILCHLAAGSGVLQTASGVRAWCGITHVPASDTYLATVTHRRGGDLLTSPLAAHDSQALLVGATCLGFIEGSSLGHIAARGVNDPQEAFNGWPRQQFDQDAASEEDGGTVWEHWSTTRDIRASSAIGSSVVASYLTLVSRLGGRYVAAVARGRREHEHPVQLVALVKAGLLTAADATWDLKPDPIPEPIQALLYEARPEDSLRAAESLVFGPDRPRYYMFQRRISEWSSTGQVRRDLGH